ncbi:MAG: hypothetical protein C4317_00365 [Acidimicrobiia bacterium]
MDGSIPTAAAKISSMQVSVASESLRHSANPERSTPSLVSRAVPTAVSVSIYESANAAEIRAKCSSASSIRSF